QFRLRHGRRFENIVRDEDLFSSGLTGANRERVLSMWQHKMDDKPDYAGEIQWALIDRAQWVDGRSRDQCERSIRDALAGKSAAEIEEIKNDYRRRYHKDLSEVLKNDPNLSDFTKKSVEISLKGAENRTDRDSVALMRLAMRDEDIDLFGEA